MFRTEHPMVSRLRALNPDDLSPREALKILYELGSVTRRKEDD
jgi:hypothetical protein